MAMMTRMISAEERIEWEYRYLERLGFLVGKNNPTLQQEAMARADADKWLSNYRKSHENDPRAAQ